MQTILAIWLYDDEKFCMEAIAKKPINFPVLPRSGDLIFADVGEVSEWEFALEHVVESVTFNMIHNEIFIKCVDEFLGKEGITSYCDALEKGGWEIEKNF
jgi:hypothetical protein